MISIVEATKLSSREDKKLDNITDIIKKAFPFLTGAALATIVGKKLLQDGQENPSLFEIDPTHIHLAKSVGRQAAVWGLGGALASKLGEDKNKKKPLTPEERKRERMKTLKQFGIGAAAGGLGAALS